MKKLPSIKAILLAVIAISCIEFTANKIKEITVLQPTAAFTTLGNTVLESIVVKNNIEKQNIDVLALNDLSSLKQEIEVAKFATSSPVIVYEGMTLDELTAKLDRSFKSDLTGYGYAFANYSLEYGVDPFLAVAVTLHETGCTWECSYLVKTCNNVGGMKGSGCGAYGSFDSLDSGIKAMISNLANNYVSKGLTTPETIGPRYAMSNTWATKIRDYMEKIQNS